MAEQQTQTPTPAKRGRPAAGAKSTASSGNANRRHKPSLSGRMGALERTIARQDALLKRIARVVT